MTTINEEDNENPHISDDEIKTDFDFPTSVTSDVIPKPVQDLSAISEQTELVELVMKEEDGE